MGCRTLSAARLPAEPDAAMKSIERADVFAAFCTGQNRKLLQSSSSASANALADSFTGSGASTAIANALATSQAAGNANATANAAAQAYSNGGGSAFSSAYAQALAGAPINAGMDLLLSVARNTVLLALSRAQYVAAS